MAWTNPRNWKVGDLRNDADADAKLNEQIRDNLLALDQHGHSGVAGDGGSSLGPIDQMDFADQAGDPATTGRLQRNGADLVYFDGTTAYNITSHSH